MKEKSYSLSQLLALCSVVALTPALRLLPGLPARLAGQGAWLAVLTALPAAVLYGLFLWRFSHRRLPGESINALWLRAAGPRAGRLLLAAAGLWLLFYAAFTLRAGAERLIATVYPRAPRALFILPLGALAALAAARDALRLARMAKLVLPLLIGALALTLCFALPGLQAESLTPLTGRGAGALLVGALPTLDAALLVLTLFFFLSDALRGEARYRSVALRILLLGTLLALVVAVTVGSFGPTLTARLTQPYFSLVRNLVLFENLERMEALLVTLWLFSDFLLVAALLLLARRCLLPLLGKRRWLPAALGALALIGACLLAPDALRYARLSERWVPALNLGVCLLLFPGVYLFGKLRRRL